MARTIVMDQEIWIDMDKVAAEGMALGMGHAVVAVEVEDINYSLSLAAVLLIGRLC